MWVAPSSLPAGKKGLLSTPSALRQQHDTPPSVSAALPTTSQPVLQGSRCSLNSRLMPAITLEQLLAARDARYELQQQLRRDYPQATLIVLTVVLPGKVKRCDDSLTIARAAVEQVEKACAGSVEHRLERDLETGFEAYWLVSHDQFDVKRLLVNIEEEHPLGRLFDLDVIGTDGAPLSRQCVGKPARRCLLCDNEARFCMRNKTHTYDEILQKIREMIDAYRHEPI